MNTMQSNTQQLDVNPLCGTCGSNMSPRDGGKWFCAACVEYGSYVGIISTVDAEHPAFYDRCTSSMIGARELLIGRDVEYSPYGRDGVDYLGRIDSIKNSERDGIGNVITMVREPAEPFHSQSTVLEFEEFCKLWEKPTPWDRGRDVIENESTAIFVM